MDVDIQSLSPVFLMADRIPHFKWRQKITKMVSRYQEFPNFDTLLKLVSPTGICRHSPERARFVKYQVILHVALSHL